MASMASVTVPAPALSNDKDNHSKLQPRLMTIATAATFTPPSSDHMTASVSTSTCHHIPPDKDVTTTEVPTSPNDDGGHGYPQSQPSPIMTVTGPPRIQCIAADALPLASKHFFTQCTCLDMESESSMLSKYITLLFSLQKY